MEITASLVKELRERSGAGMMECKKALSENGGNIDAAMEYLRKTGLAKADKKADRVAAEGRIASAQDGGNAVLVEINSETDFVAKDENFVAFTGKVAAAALSSGAADAEALKSVAIDGAMSTIDCAPAPGGIGAPRFAQPPGAAQTSFGPRIDTRRWICVGPVPEPPVSVPPVTVIVLPVARSRNQPPV